jgi:hypothetical protein
VVWPFALHIPPASCFFSDLGSITDSSTSAQMIGLSRFAGGPIVQGYFSPRNHMIYECIEMHPMRMCGSIYKAS